MGNESIGRQPFHWVAPVGGTIAAGIGGVALFGWLIARPGITSFGNYLPMAASTALLLVLYGIGLIIRAREPLSRRAQWSSTILIASGTLLTFVFFLLSGVDVVDIATRWGYQTIRTFPGTRIGLISPVTAFCLALASLSFLASLPSRRNHFWRAVSAWWLGVVSLMTSLAFLLAYLYGGPLLYSGPVIPPALTTLLALVALGFALLGVAGAHPWLYGDHASATARNSYVLALVFIVLVIGVVTEGYIHYRNQERQFRSQVERELSSVASLKTEEIANWRRERLGVGSTFQKNPAFARLVRRYLNDHDDAVARDRIAKWLGQIQTLYAYDRLVLLDAQGVTRMSIPSMLTPPTSLMQPAYDETLRTGQPMFLDIARDENDKRPYLSVMVPIQDEENNNQALGVLVMRIDVLTHLYPLISRWPTSSRTANVQLVRRDGDGVVFLNMPTPKERPHLMLRVPLTRPNLPAARAVLGQEGTMDGQDLDGEPVLAAARAVPDSPWFLVARMDAKEVYAPLRERLWQMVVVVGALLIGTAAGLASVSRRQRIRVYQERHRADEAIRESEERYRDLVENSLSLICTHDLEGHILSANEASIKLTGYPRATLLRMNMLDLLEPTARDGFGVYLNTLRTEGRASGLMEVRTAAGEHRCWEYRNTLRTEGVAVPIVRGMAHDVTEQKRMEKALRESEQNLRAILSAVTESIFLIDLQGNVLAANEESCRRLGTDMNTLVGSDILSFFPPEVAERRRRQYDRVRESGESLQFEDERLGRSFLNSLYQICDVNGEVKSLALFSIDITERKRATQALQDSEELFRGMAEQLLDVLFRTDADGRLTYLSPSVYRMIGLTPEEMLGRHFTEFTPDEERSKALRTFQEALSSGQPGQNLQLLLERKDGSVFPGELNVTRVASGKHGAGMLGLVRDITERKQAEQALVESERLLYTIVNGSPIPAFIIGKDHRVMYWNKALEAISGVRSEEVVGTRRHWKALYQEKRSCMADLLLTGDTEGASQWFDTKWTKSAVLEGAYESSEFFPDLGAHGRWLHFTAAVICDSRGQVVGAMETFEDVSERRRAEEESSRLASVVRHSRELVSLATPDGRLVFLNDAGRKMLGVREKDIGQIEIMQVIPDHLHARLLNEVRPATLDDGHWEGDLQYIDLTTGTLTDVHAITFRIDAPETGTLQFFANVSLDITERKRAEAALRKSEEKYRSIVETTTEWIWEMDLAGRHTFSNVGVSAILDYSADEVVNQSIELYMHDEDRLEVERTLPQLMATKQGWRGWVLRWRHRDGSFRYLESNANPIIDATGALIGYRGADRDITAHRQAEEAREKLEAQLRQSQKMEAVGQLAGGVAHDFNNLLQVILGYVDLVLGDLPADSPKGWAMGEVRKAAERAATLTRQLLVFSRRQVIQPVDMDLNELIEGVLKMVRRVIGEHIELQFIPGGRVGTIHADKGQLEQVLMNLCVNARDAMPTGGTLTLETGSVVFDLAYCSDHPWASEGDYVRLCVTDTGCGMDEATSAQIFEPFFTTKGVGKGTGLGLATVYGTVKQHNGLIQVYSELGKGTTFRLYFPIVERPPEDVKPRVEAPVVGGTETILVAEDELLVRNLVSQVLLSGGYTVFAASDGEEALRVFEEHADVIDMAVLDVMMPKLGGREVMERIQAVCPRIRFLFSSGYSEDAVHTNFVIKEGVHLISKPYHRSDLLRAVRAVLDKPHSSG